MDRWAAGQTRRWAPAPGGATPRRAPGALLGAGRTRPPGGTRRRRGLRRRGRRGRPGGPPAGAPRASSRLTSSWRAAISLADAAGLGAVTMRRLARTLGVAPMTLYTYVPGKRSCST